MVPQELRYLDPHKTILASPRAFGAAGGLIAAVERVSGWLASETFGQTVGQEELRKCDDFPVGDHLADPEIARHDSEIFRVFEAALTHYTIENAVRLESDEGYHVIRYRAPSDRYGPHFDNDGDSGRQLSGLLYLNDDFEGGELVFPRQGLTIRPEPGLLLLFPAHFTHVHEARPVSRGTKYVVATFFR